MLGSPYVMIGTIALYLIMVLKVAPKLMKNRQPFKVDLLMQIYNVLQVLLNLFIFYELMCYSYLRSDFSILCQGHDPNDVRLNTLKLRRPVLLYLISKYLDIFDTVFFVLRKKYNQITLLHMYHHSLMIFSPYAYGSRFFDKRITTNTLLGSPYVMVATIALYLVLKVGPRLMKNRKPFKLDLLMQIYNMFQVVLNLYIFWISLRDTYMRPDFSLLCQRFDPNDVRSVTLKLRVPYLLYLFSKYLDILDTVFFLLRKKYNQITLLHVYHHSLMIFSPYAYGSRFFASHFSSLGIMNSLVHAVMYTYYFIASLKLNIDLSEWKKRVTQMQLMQFGLLAFHFGLPIAIGNPCNLDVPWTFVASANNMCMIILFSKFYYNAYIRKTKQKL
ncbi:elongation of very long chain fatty acids protein F-like isoform X2 [Stomoxys calcitrans]|nr:elongation of very long chain fatty acids protein F-like isoform X2 [Stomoxys calcitrans]